jgi:hypothetical protein
LAILAQRFEFVLKPHRAIFRFSHGGPFGRSL